MIATQPSTPWMACPMRMVKRLWASHLRQDTLLLLALMTFYRLSGVVLLAVLSRCLSSAEIGIYFFALMFAEVFILLATFRLGPVLMRRVSQAPQHAGTYFSALLGFRLLSAPVYLGVVCAAAFWLARDIWHIIAAVGLCILLDSAYFAFSNLLIALRQTVYHVAIGTVVQGLFLILFLIGMWWHPSLGTLVGANVVRAVGLVVAALIVMQRCICPIRVSWDYGFVKEGLPFFLLTLMVMLQEQLDTLLLRVFTTYETVGYYQLAFRVVFTSFFIPMAVGEVFFPHLAAKGLSVDNRRTLIWSSGGLLTCGLVGAGVAFFGATVLARILYGPIASEVARLLRPLAMLLPLQFLVLFLSAALQALHHETLTLRILAMGTVIQALAIVLLIPLWEVPGVVYARLLAAGVELGLFIWHLRELFGKARLLAA